jgi:hypothetical protein
MPIPKQANKDKQHKRNQSGRRQRKETPQYYV